MKKFFETDEFKKLNSDWKKKLIKSGFDSIETEHENQNYYINPQEFEPKIENLAYFSQCYEYRDSGKITEKLDIFIFEKHCEGISNRVLVNILKNEPNYKPLDRRTIDRRILRLLKCAGITPIEFKD